MSFCFWGDKAFILKFYNRLKDPIKDKILRENRLSIYLLMREKALKIDQQMYQREIKKKGISLRPSI